MHNFCIYMLMLEETMPKELTHREQDQEHELQEKQLKTRNFC